MMINGHTFSKCERLLHRKVIDQLFRRGRYIYIFPFKILYLDVPEHAGIFGPSPAKVLFTVPKRRFKNASSRNRIKRLLREAYRKNKPILYDPLSAKGKLLILGIVYNGNKEPAYHEIESKIILALNRLVVEI